MLGRDRSGVNLPFFPGIPGNEKNVLTHKRVRVGSNLPAWGNRANRSAHSAIKLQLVKPDNQEIQPTVERPSITSRGWWRILELEPVEQKAFLSRISSDSFASMLKLLAAEWVRDADQRLWGAAESEDWIHTNTKSRLIKNNPETINLLIQPFMILTATNLWDCKQALIVIGVCSEHHTGRTSPSELTVHPQLVWLRPTYANSLWTHPVWAPQHAQLSRSLAATPVDPIQVSYKDNKTKEKSVWTVRLQEWVLDVDMTSVTLEFTHVLQVTVIIYDHNQQQATGVYTGNHYTGNHYTVIDTGNKQNKLMCLLSL